jgi:hypothetical protein
LQGSVTLTIGYHQLEGKRVEVKKPLVVLDKVADSEGQGTQYKVRPIKNLVLTGHAFFKCPGTTGIWC